MLTNAFVYTSSVAASENGSTEMGVNVVDIDLVNPILFVILCVLGLIYVLGLALRN